MTQPVILLGYANPRKFRNKRRHGEQTVSQAPPMRLDFASCKPSELLPALNLGWLCSHDPHPVGRAAHARQPTYRVR